MKKLIINSENSHLNDDNTVDVPAKSFSKKKIALLGASVVLIICIAVFVGVFAKRNNRHDYIQTITAAKYTMLKGAAEAETTCNLISAVWYNTIFEVHDTSTDKYTMYAGKFRKDFNDSIAALHDSDEHSYHITTILACQSVAKDYMKELQDPPKGLETCYDTLCNLYAEFTNLTELALNPQGTIQTFNLNYQSYDKSFMQYYDMLEIQIPQE